MLEVSLNRNAPQIAVLACCSCSQYSRRATRAAARPLRPLITEGGTRPDHRYKTMGTRHPCGIGSRPEPSFSSRTRTHKVFPPREPRSHSPRLAQVGVVVGGKGREGSKTPLLLAYVLLTSSADLHVSPEQDLNAARRSLRYAGLAASSIRLLSWYGSSLTSYNSLSPAEAPLVYST